MMRKINHAGMALFVFFALSAVMLWMTDNLRIGPAAPAANVEGEGGHGHEEEADHDAHGPDEADPPAHADEADEHGTDEHEGHDHGGGEFATLAFEAIESIRCEHGMPTVDCNNCRFEVGVVKLHPALAKVLISTGTVEERVMAKTIRVTGEVQQDPTRVVEVPPLGSGRVTSTEAFLGQQVVIGDVLAVINSVEFGGAKAALLETRAKLEFARAALKREEDLYQKKISSEADFLDAQEKLRGAEAQYAAAEKRLHIFGLDHEEMEAINTETVDGHYADLIIRAPRSGTLIRQQVTEGDVVDGSESLFTVADLSNLWVWCDVYERDLAAIYDGLEANKTLGAIATVSAFPGVAFEGRVDLIGSEVDPHTRTVKVRVQTKNQGGRLRPGMFADVVILIPTETKRIVAPRQAVLSDEGRHFVFQHWRDDLWVRRDVKVGRESDQYIEITDGVPIGAKIVTAGAFMLKSDVLRAKMGAGCAD